MADSNWDEPAVNDYQGEHSSSMVVLVDKEGNQGETGEETVEDSPTECRSMTDIDHGKSIDPLSPSKIQGPASTDLSAECSLPSDLNETRTEISDEQDEEQTKNNDSMVTILNINETAEENAVDMTQTSQKSLLRRLYAAQANPSKEPHMRALKFVKFWPRHLRRVASARMMKDTLAIVE